MKLFKEIIYWNKDYKITTNDIYFWIIWLFLMTLLFISEKL